MPFLCWFFYLEAAGCSVWEWGREGGGINLSKSEGIKVLFFFGRGGAAAVVRWDCFLIGRLVYILKWKNLIRYLIAISVVTIRGLVLNQNRPDSIQMNRKWIQMWTECSTTSSIERRREGKSRTAVHNSDAVDIQLNVFIQEININSKINLQRERERKTEIERK